MSKETSQTQDTTDRWRVLLPEQIAEAETEAISDFADCVSISEYGTTSVELKPHVDVFDAIIFRSAELDADLLAAADNLQVISKHGVGLDNVDIEFATERSIVDCVAYDPYVSDSEIPDAVTRVDDKAALFDAADAITVHAPLQARLPALLGDQNSDRSTTSSTSAAAGSSTSAS